jgi:hypothetical protein
VLVPKRPAEAIDWEQDIDQDFPVDDPASVFWASLKKELDATFSRGYVPRSN